MLPLSAFSIFPRLLTCPAEGKELELVIGRRAQLDKKIIEELKDR
jgi:hypothetical protein